MESQTIEMSALGRPLFPGMLYDYRKHSFIPGVTLWDQTELIKHLDSRTQLETDLTFSSSDSLSSKTNLMNISASLKASFMGGLVEVGGSAKYLHDTKSSNQQARVTMYYNETTRFDELTMTELVNITYPQVFDHKTATHVVTGVLYGAQAFMVFDRTFSEDEDKQEIEGELNVMVKMIPGFSIDGSGDVNLTDAEKKIADTISCTFHGDFHLEQNPTTYMEALEVYKQLPKLLNPQDAIPTKVWLYPLCLLNEKAACLVREVTTALVSDIQAEMEELEKVERKCRDLLSNTLVDVFSDIKERLSSFQKSVNIYKLVFQKKLCQLLPAIHGGEKDEKSLQDILKFYSSSPFEAGMKWLNDNKAILGLLTSYIKSLKGIKAVDEDGLSSILCNPGIDVVVSFTFTSLMYGDEYLSTLKKFLESDEFKKLDSEKCAVSFVNSEQKWFHDPDVINRMRENLSLFKSFSEGNKEDKKMCFVFSAISDPSLPGSSIYLYEQAKLTDKQFQPVSKPPAPIVMSFNETSVCLKLYMSPVDNTVEFQVQYRENKKEEKEEWISKKAVDEDFTLTGMIHGGHYLVRSRRVGKVGVSEASDTVSVSLSLSKALSG